MQKLVKANRRNSRTGMAWRRRREASGGGHVRPSPSSYARQRRCPADSAASCAAAAFARLSRLACAPRHGPRHRRSRLTPLHSFSATAPRSHGHERFTLTLPLLLPCCLLLPARSHGHWDRAGGVAAAPRVLRAAHRRVPRSEASASIGGHAKRMGKKK
jgi:hypothetical protein